MNTKLSKSLVISLIVLGVLLGTIPVFVREAKEADPNSEVEASATLRLKQYPGLDWSNPNKEKVSVLSNEGTEQEVLSLAIGEKSVAVTTDHIPTEIAKFYEAQFKSRGLTQTKSYGDPSKDDYWVKIFQKESQYAEIEYYPTPYKNDSFTIVLFFGMLDKEED